MRHELSCGVLCADVSLQCGSAEYNLLCFNGGEYYRWWALIDGSSRKGMLRKQLKRFNFRIIMMFRVQGMSLSALHGIFSRILEISDRLSMYELNNTLLN